MSLRMEDSYSLYTQLIVGENILTFSHNEEIGFHREQIQNKIYDLDEMKYHELFSKLWRLFSDYSMKQRQYVFYFSFGEHAR
jgi:hypothetical protein